MEKIKTVLRITLPNLLLSIALSACSTTLNYKYEPTPPKSAMKASAGTVAVLPIKDSRPELNIPEKNARSIGKITANVTDMYSNELILREDVSAIVTSAVKKELELNGFKFAKPDEADMIISGDTKDFRLDIVSRDEVTIQIGLTISERASNRVLWSGLASQKSSRFAGVFGNSSKDISDFLTFSLSKAIRGALTEAAPYLNTATGNASVLRDPGAGSGRLMVRSTPPGARLYVNGVYYGITPLTVTLDSGVVEMDIKMEGYKEFKERVSIRNTETTEADFKLEKD